MFFSESVATTRSCVFSLAAEMMKVFGSNSGCGHPHGVRAKIVLVENLDDGMPFLVEVDQLHAVFGR